MKKFYLLTFYILLVCSGIVSAQNVHDKLNARKVNDALYFKIDPVSKKIFYRIDSIKFVEIRGNELVDNRLFTSVDRDQVIFQYYFFNPLRLQLEVSKEDLPDPMFEDLDKFLDQVIALGQLTSGMPLKTSSDTLSDIKAGVAARETHSFERLDKIVKTEKLIQWLLFINIKEYYECVDKPTTGPRWGVLPAHIDSLETYMHGQFKVGGKESKHFKYWVNRIVDEIYQADDPNKYTAAIERAKKLSELLVKKNARMEEIIKKMPETLKTIQWSATPTTEGCPALKMFTNTILTDYATEAAELLKTRKDAVVKVDSIVNFADKFFDKVMRDNPSTIPNRSYMRDIRRYDLKRRHITNFTFKVTTYSRDSTTLLKKSETFSKKFKVTPHTNLLFELGSGIAYTNVEYSVFSLDSTNTIVESEPRKLNFLVQLMGNFIFNWKHSDSVYPMLQLGIGNGKEYPSLSAGAGLRFFGQQKSQRLSVSLGGVFGFEQTLKDEAKLNTKINGEAELEKLVTYKLKQLPGFYLGLQYNF